MKKTLSIILTFALLVGCCATLFTSTASAAATVLSKGKSYTVYGGQAHSSCPDTGSKELTDGSKSNTNVTGAPYAGFQGSETYEIVLDLGSAQKSNVFTIYTAQNFWGISIPKGLSIAYSDTKDGDYINVSGVATSTQVGTGEKLLTSAGTMSTSELFTWTFIAGAEINARYIKFIISAANNKFVWLDEIEVAYDPDAKVDTYIPDHAVKVHKINKQVGQDQISVFTTLDLLANNQNGWGVYYQLRPTLVPNEYVVVGVCSNPNPGDGSTFDATAFKNKSKFTSPAYCTDLYMAVNGATANASVYSLIPGDVVTFANLSLTTGEYTSTYVSAGSASGTVAGMIDNKITETNLMHSIANVEKVGISDIAATLSGDSAPANAFFYTTEYETVITECVKNKVLPTIQIDTVENAKSLIAVMKAKGCYDVNVISSDPAVLSTIRKATNVARTGLIYSLTKNTVTSDEAHAIRGAVKSAPANFVVLADNGFVSKQVVMELQQLGCAVWVEAANSTDAELNETVLVTLLATGINGIISEDADLVHTLINKHFPKNSFTRTPTVVGHRGFANGGAIENTLESFKLAYQYGADIFELDVYSTTDNGLVLYHDNKFANGTGHNYNTNYTGGKYIENMTITEVRQVKYTRDNSKITELDEVLAYFQDKDIRIFIEFKGGQIDRTVKYTAEAVKKYGMEDRIVIICSATGFLDNAIKYFDGKVTNSFVYANNSITGYAPQDTPEWSYADTRAENLSILAFTLNRVGATNSNLGPALGAVSKGFNVDNFLGEAATNRGLQVNPWTYGSANNNNIGFFSDVDSITTDVTDWFTNMAKYVSFSDSVAIENGKTYDGTNFQYTTYGRKTLDVPAANIVYSVVSGDAVKVVDGKLVAVEEGDAYVLFGYKTKTTSGTEYIIYSEVTNVTVTPAEEGGDVSDPSDEPSEDPSSSEDPSTSEEPSSSEDPSTSEEPSTSEDPSSGEDPSNSEDPSNPDVDEPDPDEPPVEDDFVKGDINENGDIDSMDYVLLKRTYFGTYTLKDIRVGDINNNEIIDSMDYVYLRRAYFGTYEIK